MSSPFHGEVAAQPPEGLVRPGPPHSWGGGGAAAGGAVRPGPPHSWGGGGAAAGGAGETRSSPFMGRWRRSRRRGWWDHVLPIHGEVAAQPPEGLVRPGPTHSWGGGGAAAGGLGAFCTKRTC